jgi:hypothetical protein
MEWFIIKDVTEDPDEQTNGRDALDEEWGKGTELHCSLWMPPPSGGSPTRSATWKP